MTAVFPQSASGSSPSTNSLPIVSSEDKLRLLIDTGLLLASERSLNVIVQAALDAGRKLCGAAFGMFIYVRLGESGERCQMAATSGIDPARAAALAPLVDLRQLFDEYQHPGSHQLGVVRLDDVTQLPASQRPCIFSGLASPLRSYLAAPVRCRSSDLVGALLFGHSSPNAFTREGEDLVATIASQAAVAIDNFRLGSNLVHEVALADGARSLQRETAGRLRQALEAAQLGTFTWDRATDLLDLDERAAGLLGVSPGERITRTALRERILVPEDAPLTVLKLDQAIESGSNYHAEYRIETPAGGKLWIAANGIHTYAAGPQGPPPDHSQIVGMVGTVQDITARRNQEQTLRQSEKLAATGRLAATIAHEINNPLEAITNLIYLARTDPGIPAPVQTLLETADAELARVSQIAQQTLGFYRDTARPVTIDINELLVGIADLFKRRMRSKSLTCTFDLQPGACIFALQGEMRQVFSNLLVNAMDASHQSRLHIRTRVRRSFGLESVTVLISDHGAGIPGPVRSRLFTPFVTTKESVGTGLGLWVTRGIVEKHGGFINFRTRTEAPAGTLFRVVLPVLPPGQLSSSAIQPQLR
jgi:PAS domain S-box-containing protein